MNRIWIAISFLLMTGTITADDWSRFRGPDGSDVSTQKEIPIEWSATKNIIWKTKLPGPGSSSPITFGQHIYLTCYSGYGLPGDPPGNKSNLKRQLVCLNRENGKPLWSAVTPTEGHESPYTGYLTLHGYASHTPVADETGIYVYYGSSGAAAYSHEGKRRWHVSCGTNSHEWGSGSSPVLYKNLVIINARVEGKGLLALDKKTGVVRWNRQWGWGWCNPLLMEHNGSHELILGDVRQPITAFDPQTGKPLWQCPTQCSNYMPMPAVHNGVLYAMTRGQTAAIHADRRGEQQPLWELNYGSHVASPLYYDGYLYFPHDEQGVVYCVNTKTGKLVYKKRLLPTPRKLYASPIIVDGKVYYVSREKGVYVLQTGSEFKQLAHNVIETDRSVFNATPTISDGQLLLRSDRYLYCIAKESP